MTDELIRRIGAGLRKMKRGPSALVFVDDLLDFTWDRPSAFGVPVFHSAGFLPPNCGSGGVDCPFIPVWSEDYPDAVVDCARFAQGYGEPVK